MVLGQRFGATVKQQNRCIFWYFIHYSGKALHFCTNKLCTQQMSMEKFLAYSATVTQCKNLHQEFKKCTHTMSGFCEIFQVKKLKVTLFSTTWSLISVFICIKYISISGSIQVIHCKEWMSSPTHLSLRGDNREFFEVWNQSCSYFWGQFSADLCSIICFMELCRDFSERNIHPELVHQH